MASPVADRHAAGRATAPPGEARDRVAVMGAAVACLPFRAPGAGARGPEGPVRDLGADGAQLPDRRHDTGATANQLYLELI